ncbi:MAG: sulfotransferase family protein [Cyanobacteria bacterium J06560_6]
MNNWVQKLTKKSKARKSLKKEKWIIKLSELNAIYIAVPKVACSSIKRAIATSLNVEIPDSGRAIHRAEFLLMDKDSMISQKGYFKFGFVRNPWDRLVSCYSDKIVNDENFSNDRYDKGIPRAFHRYKVFKANMPFRDFLEAVVDIPDDDADRHWRSQYTFLSDQNRNLVPDYIGRFENLEEDFSHVFKELGNSDIRLPHSNKSKRNSIGYRDYFTDDMLSIFEKRYAKDIEVFNYTF